MLKGLTTRGCEAYESKIFRISSTIIIPTQYELSISLSPNKKLCKIKNKKASRESISFSLERNYEAIQVATYIIFSERISFLIRLFVLFIVALPIVTMNTYISNGRRHVVNRLTNIKVGKQLVLFIISD